MKRRRDGGPGGPWTRGRRGRRMADAAAGCKPGMQRIPAAAARGTRPQGTSAQRPPKGALEWAEIRRPRRAMDAGAPRGRMADAAAAFSARMPRHSRGRRTGNGGARRSAMRGRRRALEAAENGDLRRWMVAEARRRASGEISEESGIEEAASLGMRRRGCRVRGGQRQAENAAHGGGSSGSPRGERSLGRYGRGMTPSCRADSQRPAGQNGTQARHPGSGGCRADRGARARTPAAARGEQAQAPAQAVAAGCPAGGDVSDWGEAHPGGAGSLYGCEGDHVRDGTCQEHPRRPGGIWIWHGGAPPGCKAQSTRWATCW